MPLETDSSQFCPVCGKAIEIFSHALTDFTNHALQTCAECAQDRTALGLPLLPTEQTKLPLFEPEDLQFCTACGERPDPKRFFYVNGYVRALCLACFTSETD